MWEKVKAAWPHLVWFLAAIIVMMDPDKIFEWAHKHELWGGLIIAIWTALMAWAAKHRPQGPPAPVPPSGVYTQQQGRKQ